MILTLKRPILWQVSVVAAFLFSFLFTPAGANEPAPVLKLASGSVSRDGHVKIQWRISMEFAEVEVQQAGEEDFTAAKTVYRGPDRATFISGLENGAYYFRVRRVGSSAWSDPVMLTVQHHSLRLALILFSLGAVVFALTVFIVVKGALRGSTD